MRFLDLLLTCAGLATAAKPATWASSAPGRCVDQLQAELGRQIVIAAPIGQVLEFARESLNPNGPLVERLERPSEKLVRFHSEASRSLRPLEECVAFEAEVARVLDQLACMKTIVDLSDRQYKQFKKAIGRSKQVDDVFAAVTLCKFLNLLS